MHQLHAAHRELFDYVMSRHDKVICVLGMSNTKSTEHDPLDFHHRQQMINEKYESVICAYQKDCRDNLMWSKQLDSTIKDLIGPTQSAMLYGSRDSFIPCYGGSFSTSVLEASVVISGGAIRKRLANQSESSEEFRAGAIWATHNQYQSPKPTVDMAITNSEGEFLMAQKPNESALRFVGGFVDANESLEEAALRETKEETGLSCEGAEYLGSAVIEDWRYRSEKTNIVTAFFLIRVDDSCGDPLASDDIESLRWVSLQELLVDATAPVVKEHLGLLAILDDTLI